jgi:hypothetical protein
MKRPFRLDRVVATTVAAAVASHIAADEAHSDAQRPRRRRSTRTLLAVACLGALPALAACGAASSAAGDADTASTEVAGTTADQRPDDEAFCDVLGESAELANAFADPTTDPAEVAESFAQLAELFARLAELAPEEVRDDVALVADAIIAVNTTPTDDPDALSKDLDVATSPEVTKATEAVGRYSVEVCGMSPEAWEG